MMLDCLDTEGGGNMGFACAGATDQHDVVGLIEEVAAMELAHERLVEGVSQTLLEAAITQPRPVFSCFVNLLQSEEARKQIILVIDGPAA